MLVNLTPHVLNIEDCDGQMQTVPASGQIARVSMEYRPAGILSAGADFPVVSALPGAHTGLPGVVDGQYYVVSLLAAQAAWATGRADVYSPGELVRDADGKPVGCKGLQCNPMRPHSLFNTAATSAG